MFGRAARDAGVGRIVYLGGLIPSTENLSPHLESRTEVGEILLASGVPTAVLRAAVILGSGSASFEMMRYLTERLPAMSTPRWVDNRIQPIAISDVLHYLVGSATMGRGGRMLRLRAEMRLPGLAWLELTIVPGDRSDRCSLHQVALVRTHGLAGQVYWWLVTPFHGIVFGAMQRGMRTQAERLGGRRGVTPASAGAVRLRPARRRPWSRRA